MKAMTRVFALILALALMLAGCGGDRLEDIRGEVTPNGGQETAQAPSQEENNPVSLGTLEGGVYSNPYAGFGCELDEHWIFSGAEELQNLPENVRDLLEDTELAEGMAGLEQITDMLAQNTQLLTSMNVLYQKLGANERMMGRVMGEETLIDSILAQKDAMISAYATMGLEVASMEKVSVTFLEKPRFAVLTKGTTQGLDTYILQLFDYTRGSYSITLTLTSYVQDNSQTMLDLFYVVE